MWVVKKQIWKQTGLEANEARREEKRREENKAKRIKQRALQNRVKYSSSFSFSKAASTRMRFFIHTCPIGSLTCFDSQGQSGHLPWLSRASGSGYSQALQRPATRRWCREGQRGLRPSVKEDGGWRCGTWYGCQVFSSIESNIFPPSTI